MSRNKKIAIALAVLILLLGMVGAIYSLAGTENEAEEGKAESAAASETSAAAERESLEEPEIELPYYYDEAFYATLDYYGNIEESSVVKSYYMNGNTSITDYGSYTEVENLTDEAVARREGDKLSFSWSREEAPDNFYFEGHTQKPYESFPWTLKLSYKLNGIERRAEDIAGEKGVVEICLDAVPNEAATEYMRNNLVLAATSVFNADDILSLEAEGAQVQMLGNQRAVVFMVLPGEEQHFTMRVGTESFEYAGMILAAFPATLKQLEMIGELKDAKDDIEDSYNALDSSLDVVLNALDGMSGSLNAAADGLDKLNASRESLYSRKDELKNAADLMIEGLDGMDEGLKPLDSHLDEMGKAVSETNGKLKELSETSAKLREELEDVQDFLEDIQLDARKMGKKGGSLKSLADSLSSLRTSLVNLSGASSNFDELEKSLLSTGVYKDDGSEYTPTELLRLINSYESAEPKWGGYEELLQNYPAFLTAGALEDSFTSFDGYLTHSVAAAQIEARVKAAVKEAMLASDNVKAAIAQLEAAYGLSTEAATAQIVAQMENPATELGTAYANAVAENLLSSKKDLYKLEALYLASKDEETMTKLTQGAAAEKAIGGTTSSLNTVLVRTANLCGELEDLTDDLRELANDIDEDTESLDDVIATAKTALKKAEELIAIFDKYEPELQSSISDMKKLSSSTSKLVTNSSEALHILNEVAEDNDEQLNDGLKESLSGLSDSIRRGTRGLDQTYIVRNSKDTIDRIIREKWDENMGEKTNLLKMDAKAEAESLTSSENQAPDSIQFMMRTKEIKVEAAEAAEAAKSDAAKVGIIGKLKELFSGLFSAVKGIFG